MSFRRMRHLKPREVQGCALALDASIPGSLWDATSGGSLVAPDGAVARWEDQSGNSRHVTQGTPANRPLRRLSGLSSGPSLDFDGLNHRLVSGSLDITAMYDSAGTSTFFASVLTQRAAKAQNTIISSGISATNRFNVHASYDDILYFDAGSTTSSGRVSGAQPSGWDDAAHVFAAVRNGTSGNLSSDNKTVVTKTDFSYTVTSATITISIGGLVADPSAYHSGQIAEIAVWAKNVNAALVKRFVHSRQRKWRIAG